MISTLNHLSGLPPMTKFSEDVVPLADLKVNPGCVVAHVETSHRPVLLTKRGRGVAVVQSVAADERSFVRAVVAGLTDLEEGRERSLDDVKARLRLPSALATPNRKTAPTSTWESQFSSLCECLEEVYRNTDASADHTTVPARNTT